MENKKFKVEIKQTDTYVVDVLAKDEAQALEFAEKAWNNIAQTGTYHYYQVGDTENDFGLVYDVTETDDPFNPENEPSGQENEKQLKMFG